ncbi:MAG: ABC transporter permease [Planctomycetaceae bacterium]|nr:MAG: ABC transporter permease [Planctomycetaceae bacterium]
MSLAAQTETLRSGRGSRGLAALKRFILNPRWLALLAILILWQVYAMVRDSRIIPFPADVAEDAWEILRTGLFIEHVAASSFRILVGFTCAMIVGTTVGVLMGSRRSWDEFFKDLVVFGLALPGLIYALLSVMVFGISLAAPVVAILGTAYPFVAVNVSEGVRSIDKELLDMGRAYKVGRGKVVRQIIMPSLLPFIFAAIRTGFAISWKVCTLVEVFGAVNGAGFMIRSSFLNFSTAGIIAWSLVFAGLMLVIEYGVLVPLERYFSRWRPKAQKVV